MNTTDLKNLLDQAAALYHRIHRASLQGYQYNRRAYRLNALRARAFARLDRRTLLLTQAVAMSVDRDAFPNRPQNSGAIFAASPAAASVYQ